MPSSLEERWFGVMVTVVGESFRHGLRIERLFCTLSERFTVELSIIEPPSFTDLYDQDSRYPRLCLVRAVVEMKLVN